MKAAVKAAATLFCSHLSGLQESNAFGLRLGLLDVEPGLLQAKFLGGKLLF